MRSSPERKIDEIDKILNLTDLSITRLSRYLFEHQERLREQADEARYEANTSRDRERNQEYFDEAEREIDLQRHKSKTEKYLQRARKKFNDEKTETKLTEILEFMKKTPEYLAVFGTQLQNSQKFYIEEILDKEISKISGEIDKKILG
ncbi:hypothetical protein [Thalassospira marina]|nr:hypothetical protein [Thalassospira marina]